MNNRIRISEADYSINLKLRKRFPINNKESGLQGIRNAVKTGDTKSNHSCEFHSYSNYKDGLLDNSILLQF